MWIILRYFIYPSYFKPQLRGPLAFTRITYSGKLIGISESGALPGISLGLAPSGPAPVLFKSALRFCPATRIIFAYS
ncbi:hypothetical protein AD997_05870 [Erwinia amylovora]|nr:hypothetical protein AD997_05870 [Erwinia amylovora]